MNQSPSVILALGGWNVAAPGAGALQPAGLQILKHALTNLIMEKTKDSVSLHPQPIATGQIWRVGEMNMKIGRIGPFMVTYKLAKPNAVRTRTEIDGRTALQKYLTDNKAVLIQA